MTYTPSNLTPDQRDAVHDALSWVRADLRTEVMLADDDEVLDVWRLADRYTLEWLEGLTDE